MQGVPHRTVPEADVGAVFDDDVAVLAAQDGVAANEHAVADGDAAVVGAFRIQAAQVVDHDVVADVDFVRMAQRHADAKHHVTTDRSQDPDARSRAGVERSTT